MELACFGLEKKKKEATKRVVEEMKQHFHRGEKNVTLLLYQVNLFPHFYKSVSCQLQFQF